ncbi:hypothetical protein [Shewanella maritima]|uniref:hypothetical protein n=1 Tax=Shewanella maritima TaxID=2520507 RepID=UPI003734F6EA
MLAVIMAASVFTGSISADSAGIFREESAFFNSEVQGKIAKVTSKKKLSNGALQAACRRALSMPNRYQLRQSLQRQTEQILPTSVSFIDASITNFTHNRTADGVECQGDVVVNDESYNLAGLAIVTAWAAAEKNDLKLLRPMLKLALSHEKTQSDAVALIASQTDAVSGLAYLDQHLVPQQITLDQGKLAVGKMWLADQRYQAVIDLMSSCDQTSCRQVSLNAQVELEALEQQQADDLSSYF